MALSIWVVVLSPRQRVAAISSVGNELLSASGAFLEEKLPVVDRAAHKKSRPVSLRKVYAPAGRDSQRLTSRRQLNVIRVRLGCTRGDELRQRGVSNGPLPFA